MGTEFQVGDKARCIDSRGYRDGRLTEGKVYTVIKSHGITQYSSPMITVKWDNGCDGQNIPGRFEKVGEGYTDGYTDGSFEGTKYYYLPHSATELRHLIAAKGMSFARGNIFKACYRLGEKQGVDVLYDLKKIKAFAEELIEMHSRGEHL